MQFYAIEIEYLQSNGNGFFVIAVTLDPEVVIHQSA